MADRFADDFKMRFRKTAYRRLKRAQAGRELQTYLASHPSPKLNIGCGGNSLDGWFNTDLTPDRRSSFLDAGAPFPYAANTFDAVLCEHMIEHIHKMLGRQLLAETFRVLKPGGKFRVITPDLAVLAEVVLDAKHREERVSYLEAQKGFFSQPDMTWCDAVNRAFYSHGHRYIYSPDELSDEMRAVGFTDLVVGRAGFPTDDVFEGVEGHVAMFGREVNAIDAFSIEAVKPL